jgi:hypothetical protein
MPAITGASDMTCGVEHAAILKINIVNSLCVGVMDWRVNYENKPIQSSGRVGFASG